MQDGIIGEDEYQGVIILLTKQCANPMTLEVVAEVLVAVVASATAVISTNKWMDLVRKVIYTSLVLYMYMN